MSPADSNAPARIDRPADGMVHLWSVGLDRPAEQLQLMRHLLSSDELSRADRLLDKQLQNRFIACRGALRGILARYLTISPKQISLTCGAHGKPLLSGRQTDDGTLTFNLSHSQDLALIAVASNRQIGIDLERIDPDLDFEPLARRIFYKGETEALLTVPPQKRRTAFYRCWTLKEAYMKGTGLGFSLPPDRFEVCLDPASPTLLSCPEGPTECDRWHLQDLPAPQGFAAALAIKATSQGDTECSILNYEF